MTRALLTEPEAWRVIAVAYLEPLDASRALAERGLCWAVRELWLTNRVGACTASRMSARINEYLPHADAYAYSSQRFGRPDPDDRIPRGMAALWLALDAEETP